MKFIVFVIFLIFIPFVSCKRLLDSKKEEKNHILQIDNKSLLAWDIIKNRFPYENIQEYDFETDGKVKNDLSKIVKLDSGTFNELISKVKQYSEWQKYLEIYYYSRNRIGNNEVAVFYVKKEFDGGEYSFDLIQFTNTGEIETIKTIAKSWTEAGCLGYTRTKIDLKSNQIYQEILKKCYNEEEVNNESVDSTINIISLKQLKLKY